MRKCILITTFCLYSIAGWGNLSSKDKEEVITPLYSVGNQISLNGIWKFKYFPSLSVGNDSLFYLKDFDVSHWGDIKVPGHWELQGYARPGYANVDEGTGLYRTTFRLPPLFGIGRVFVRFEGVLYAFDVYINGKHAGKWTSSFNAVSFDITNLIDHQGENIIAVKVSTRSKEYQFDTSDCWALSGIFRDVIVFSTPDIYADDFTIRTFLNEDNSARVIIKIKLQASQEGILDRCQVKAVLYSPVGKMLIEKTVTAGSLSGTFEFNVEDPELWTAETPALYNLELQLIQEGKVIQEISQHVGIREVKIVNAILKLNDKNVKLRGIDHHDLYPETGRTLSEEQILKDLVLMKRANINFIRTSHYPPDRRMLNLCDSMGFYVMCEVPFNYGSGPLLRDSLCTEILLRRASATLLRDKNHPSVIIWSLGNENPLTPFTEITGKWVKQADPTRPICYPMRGDYFNATYPNFPEFIDIWSPHYERAIWLKNFASETTKPVIMTEYAHALGLSFGNLEDIWTEMFRNNKIAGGAVWHFQDQGILRKANQPVDVKKPTTYAWPDSVHYYDTNTIDGVDGIVYSDRTPQVDYWQVRKVYSPVQVIESEIPVVSGKQELKITIYNQYDFTNISALDGLWKLYRNRKIYNKGQITVNCAPHDTAMIAFPVDLPGNLNENVWLLQFEFKDKEGEQIYEHTISLSGPQRFTGIKDRVYKNLNEDKLDIVNKENGVKIKTRDFIYEIEKSKLAINLVADNNNKSLINDGIFVRIGRTPKIADISVRDRFFSENNDYFREPFLLKPGKVENGIEIITKDEYSFSAKGIFLRGEKFPGERIEGEIHYTIKNNGSLMIRYNLKPVNTTGVFLEAGISFILPPEITSFQWLGDGPYPSYPDKYQLNDFGIYHVSKEDINFNGNRSNVEIAILTDDNGNGIAISGDKANISVELNNHQIVVSHNALLTGLSNKKTMPTYLVRAQEVNEIKGEFQIIPLRAGHWPEKLKDILGYPVNSVRPFNPFFYSYDTSK